MTQGTIVAFALFSLRLNGHMMRSDISFFMFMNSVDSMRLATVRRSHLFSPQINGHMAGRRVISQKDVARLAMVIVSGK